MNPKLIGDINGDGKVDLIDKALILQSLGTTINDVWGYGEGAFNKEADLNDDDVIDETDLQIWEEAYAEGPTSGLRVVNKDPFMWQARTSPCLSWSGWVQTHPHEECPGEVLPDEFKWDFKWLEKPYRGCYAYCKVYYPYKEIGGAVPYMPKGVGTVVVRQGHSPRQFAQTMNLRCEGGYQFEPVSVFETPHKVVMRYKFNIIDSGYWFGVGIDVWGSFSEPIYIHGVTTDFFELILYDYLTGLLGELCPPFWFTDNRYACGLEWVILRWNSTVIRSPNEWITCEFDLGDGLNYIAKEADLNGVEAYIHGVDLIMELLNAEGEVWFDRAWYLAPAKPKEGVAWLPSTTKTVSILATQ